MIPHQIEETSILISLFRSFNRRYSYLKQRLSYIYQNSHLFRMTEVFWEKIKVCLRYSFLGRITQPWQGGSGTLDNSRFAQYLVNFFKRRKDRLIHYLKTSLMVVLAGDTKEQLNLSPVRIISIITLTAITVNVALSIMLQKQIGLWGWLMRGLFLFAACAGLFCKADWPTIKHNSLFLRRLEVG